MFVAGEAPVARRTTGSATRPVVAAAKAKTEAESKNREVVGREGNRQAYRCRMFVAGEAPVARRTTGSGATRPAGLELGERGGRRTGS